MAEVFRVTVRGRFFQLSDASRRWLVASQDEHDIFRSSFTQEGTFTYDPAIDFFNLRYEVRVEPSDAPPSEAEGHAIASALLEAEAFLRTMKIGFRNLTAKSMDMSAMVKRL